MNTPSLDLRRQGITRGRQIVTALLIFLQMILELIDQRLRMLDPHPHRKCFRLKENLLFVKEFINITRRMTRRKNDSTSSKLLSIRRHDPMHAGIVD